MNKKLYTRLTRLAYDLQQSGDDLDRAAAHWILSRSKHDYHQQRKRQPRSVKARVKDARGGEFWIAVEQLKEAEAETYQGPPP